MPKSYEDGMKVIVALLPQDLSVGGANKQGDWVSLANYDSCTIIYASDVGTANQDCDIDIRQATTNTGGSAKNLNGPRWYGMQHGTPGMATGDASALLGTSDFTDDGETAAVARCEVTADMLDVGNDFRFIQVRASDSGAAAGKLGAAFYVLQGARHSVDVPNQPAVTT